ncbi:hypothetical protein DCS_05953 [Drechmeria coniospora]|uniref:Uncharacterized protein n=1 Tax=Drechmeria coniospora TaxID=98403 RepID=A0A151GA84_DRECN|nr:hypothetical protein DCS_05953 [Drechmeria coniospora]KYK54003.1 hypothetical protein DCS_05953 [Drechmeria coniospora]
MSRKSADTQRSWLLLGTREEPPNLEHKWCRGTASPHGQPRRAAEVDLDLSLSFAAKLSGDVLFRSSSACLIRTTSSSAVRSSSSISPSTAINQEPHGVAGAKMRVLHHVRGRQGATCIGNGTPDRAHLPSIHHQFAGTSTGHTHALARANSTEATSRARRGRGAASSSLASMHRRRRSHLRSGGRLDDSLVATSTYQQRRGCYAVPNNRPACACAFIPLELPRDLLRRANAAVEEGCGEAAH